MEKAAEKTPATKTGPDALKLISVPNLAFHWSGLFNCEMISKICLFLFIDFLLLSGYNHS